MFYLSSGFHVVGDILMSDGGRNVDEGMNRKYSIFLNPTYNEVEEDGNQTMEITNNLRYAQQGAGNQNQRTVKGEGKKEARRGERERERGKLKSSQGGNLD